MRDGEVSADGHEWSMGAYATDFIDRFENEIVPALRAGFIVLTDRYIYSLMARAIVDSQPLPAWGMLRR